MFKWFKQRNKRWVDTDQSITEQETLLLEKLDALSSRYPKYDHLTDVKNGKIFMVESSEEEQ